MSRGPAFRLVSREAARGLRNYRRVQNLKPDGFLRGYRAQSTLLLHKDVELEFLTGQFEGVAVLSLNRPHVRNALGRQQLSLLQQSVQELRDRQPMSARALVLVSKVEGVFSAGADLKERRGMSPEETRGFVSSLRTTFHAISSLPMPVLAAVEGVALGGGCELCLACDMRIAGSAAAFALPEVGLAIIPGAGGTQRLPRLVGPSRAKELIFTGRRISAGEAAAIGLVDMVVDPGQSVARSLEIAQAIAKQGPLAVRMAKRAINGGMERSIEAGLAVEEECYEVVLGSEDRMEGLAAFAEKRKPEYVGA